MEDDKAIAVQEPTAPATLFGTSDAKAVIAAATERATALADVIRERKLATKISGKEHVRVEGWTLLGSMLGVFPVCVWTRPVENGWEARVEARTMSGQVIGAAEAECLQSEKNWSGRDDFALRSMAQTRATSKALRLPLGFIMTLAGYEATPAEEMTGDEYDSRKQAYSQPAGGWDGTREITSGKNKGKQWKDLSDRSINFYCGAEFGDGPMKDMARLEKARREGAKAEEPKKHTPEEQMVASIKAEVKKRNISKERFAELMGAIPISGENWKEMAAQNDLETLRALYENVEAEALNLEEEAF